MTIDLKNISSYVLTLKDTPERLNNFQSELSNHLNVTPFYGDRYPTSTEGCVRSSYKMYQHVNPPVLIFEDDVKLTPHFTTTLTDVPDDADAVYLGTSAWGIKNYQSSLKNLNLQKYNDKYFKIEYMTTTHAILFLSNRFWTTMLNTFHRNINNVPIENVDVHIARLHPQFNIYAVAKPMCYQNTPYNDYLTSYPLEDIYKEFNP